MLGFLYVNVFYT